MTDIHNEEEGVAGHLAEEALITFIAERAREAWEARQQPYYLSNLAPALKQAGFTYRDVTGEGSLAAWAEGANQEEWRVVRHPQQTSKIGVVPAGSPFTFDAAEAGASVRDDASRLRKKPIVVRFLEELRKLDQSDLDKIVLPVSVIVKLLDE